MNEPLEPQGAEEHAPPSDEMQAAALQIIERLAETNTGLVHRVVQTIGVKRSLDILKRTLEIEADKGLLTHDGGRRRTAGGVFFFLVRGRTSEAERDKLWPNREDKKRKKEETAAAEAQRKTDSEAAAEAKRAERAARPPKAAGERPAGDAKRGPRPDRPGGDKRPATGRPAGPGRLQQGGPRPPRGDRPGPGARPGQDNRPPRREWTPRPAPGEGELVAPRPRPEPLTWEDRIPLFYELQEQPGVARIVSIRLIGRPKKILKRKGVTIVTMTNPPSLPKLPRELPLPEQDETVYLVFIAARQWETVESALEDQQDQLIITGLPVLDKKLGAITVLAQNITTIVLDRTRRDY